tara:strand:- start:872 stop:1702 length:831 start_codon:yes stop_codon:yes gene_type:complete
MKIEDITFVITTFKSEKVIFDCLNSLPETSPKIIVENSGNEKLKSDLESKYKNLKCFIMVENLGYGKANNFGINRVKTDYVFILNPDATLYDGSLNKIISIIKDKDFCIASPIESINEKEKFYEKNYLEVEFVRGFAMLLNLKKMNFGYFDEKIFLYLEEIDLCRRARNNSQIILLINVKINHKGGFSHGSRENLEMEKSRNWHWMWSKFYYNKKHFGYIIALFKTIPNLISSFIKIILYSILKNNFKKNVYLMRLSGLLASYTNQDSYYRPFKKK